MKECPEIIEEKTLASGEKLRILRLVMPSETPVPERFKRYIAASLGYDSYYRAVSEINYWRLYFRSAMDGNGAVDHLYLAEVDGALAARAWFAYSRRSGYGNFGNVYTEPEYRRRGLMNKLMEPLMRDFYASDAKMLCCATGSEFAAQVYFKHGFHAIYGGKTGPLCALKKEYGSHFLDLQNSAFDGSPVQVIRVGAIDDQYDCDKFLAYHEQLWGKGMFRPRGPASLIVDYRTAYQETRRGNGTVAVAENGKGTIVAWAFALKIAGQNCMNITFHPNCSDGAVKLIRFIRNEFDKQFPGEPLLIYLAPEYTPLWNLMKPACCEPVAKIPGALPGQPVWVFRADAD